MFKKTLISVAVASSLGLTGCFSGGESGGNADPDYKISNPAIDGKTWPIFNPVTSQLPIPNDLIFDSEQGDGTFGVSDTTPPVTTALNELSGASTVAPTVIQFNGRINASTVAANQTVFLIEVAYASGDPVQGLSISEPPTLELALSGPTALPQITADVVTLDGNSAIRIVPTKPLNPRKRYIAVVTKGVQDVNGDPITQSPSYANLTDDAQPLGTSSLAPVRTLINRVWEPLAEAYFGAVSAPLTAEDIAISYSFTTSNDEKVLSYIAEPAAWFADQIESFVKVSAADSAVKGGASAYADVAATVNSVYGMFPNIPASTGGTIADKLPQLFGPGKPCEGLTGQTAVDCVGFSLANAGTADGGFADLLPVPQQRNVTVDVANTNDVALASAPVSSAAGGAGNVNLVQGTIDLPYYLGTPSGTNGSPLVTESWKADSGLASAMNAAFAGLDLELPHADPSVTTAINYIFPFPKGEVQEAPFLVLYPSSGDVSGGTVIYQHGITTDRSAALSFGSALVSTLSGMGTNVAVVAIDQPLHGVTPFSTESQDTLAGLLLEGAGLTNDQPTRTAVINGQFSIGVLQVIDAGCTAINPDYNDPSSVETAIQTVLAGGCEIERAGSALELGGALSIENTTAAAGSTIPGIAATNSERHFDFYANAANQPVQMNFDPTVAAGEDESGSLFINLTNFLASRDNNRQGAVDMMNLRASLGAIDINGAAMGGTLNTTNVYFVGHSLGTINGSPFVAASNENQIGAPFSPKTSDDVVAASLLTPGAGIVRLLENSPTFAPAILGGLNAAAGLEQGDANLETYFNVLQATLDTVDPINFSDNHVNAATGLLLSEVLGDTVIPNSAGEGETLGNAFIAPLAGTEPLAVTLSANDVTAAGSVNLPAITRYTAGTHGTPVSADNVSVFTEMVGQTVAMILTGGASTTATDDSVIQP
ncbi:hypothetical protein [Marinobacter alexandrii]|jgi:hypothetical protein|uniref:hypothetical protein n=1 Tax=Marinobacter alexandrii TaxID=2570351 RepID=UPI002ABE13DD|nr:hypothetical protein [Marinobacter alexandrii]